MSRVKPSNAVQGGDVVGILGDMNGEVFTGNASGMLDVEQKELIAWRVLKADGTVNTAATLMANFNALSELKSMPGWEKQYTDMEKMQIAGIRTLVLKQMWAAPAVENAHVKVIHCLDVSDAEGAALVSKTAFEAVPAAERSAFHKWMVDFCPKLTDVTCIVAYFFRVRGHHFQADMIDKYDHIWETVVKSQGKQVVQGRGQNVLGLRWEYIAREALHCIVPAQLDRIWKDAADNGKCAGPLNRRYNCPAAGTAILATVRAGLDDMMNVLPPNMVTNYLAPAIMHLEECERKIAVNRWTGSVNHNFYGAPNLVIKESLFAPLASMVVTMLGEVDNRAPLAQAKSLQRAAGNAPITGMFLARGLKRLLDSQPDVILGQIATAGSVTLPAIESGPP